MVKSKSALSLIWDVLFFFNFLGIVMSNDKEKTLRQSINQLAKLLIIASVIGLISGSLMIVYLAIANWGEAFFGTSPAGLPIGIFWPLILLVIGGLIVGLSIRIAGEYFQLGSTQKEFAETKGRMDYGRHLLATLFQTFVSLWSGASVGPEGGLAEIGGGIGTLIYDKLKIKITAANFLTYCGVAGSFGAFFGNPIIGAFVGMEYLLIQGIPYPLLLIPGLASATFGYLVYFQVFPGSLAGTISFPTYAGANLFDLIWALMIGLIGALFAHYHMWVFSKFHALFSRLKDHPIQRGLIGGVTVGLIGSFIPLLLYSGQKQLIAVLFQGTIYGVAFLILLVFGKSLVMALSFNTVFKGGPIFPYLFMGGVMGLAISQLMPFIPEGGAITSGMGAVMCGLFPIPLSIVVFLSLMSQLNLVPAIVVATFTSFVFTRYLNSRKK
jgi:H+/Cl- antiporter ClcA